LRRDRIVITSGVRRGMEALGVAIRRQKNVLLWGPPGIGKSTLISHALHRRGLWEGVRVRVVSIRLFRHETARQIVHALCCAIEGDGADPRARVTESVSELFYRLFDLLDHEAADCVLVLVDEMDYALGSATSDILRDLYDECGGRVLFAFISIAAYAAKMAAPSTPLLEAAASRLAVHRKLNGASQADAQMLADQLLDNIRLEPDVVAHFLKSARGSVRALLDLYEDAESVAQIAGVKQLSLAKWTELRRLGGGLVDEAPTQKLTTQSTTHLTTLSPDGNTKKAVA
jgi:AAA domain